MIDEVCRAYERGRWYGCDRTKFVGGFPGLAVYMDMNEIPNHPNPGRDQAGSPSRLRTTSDHGPAFGTDTGQYPQVDSAQVFTIPGADNARPVNAERRVVRLNWSSIAFALLAAVVVLLVLYATSFRSRDTEPQSQRPAIQGQARGATPTSRQTRAPRHLAGAARPRRRATVAHRAPLSTPKQEQAQTPTRTYRRSPDESTPVTGSRSSSVGASSGQGQTGGLFSP
jgi:hypothetical protein